MACLYTCVYYIFACGLHGHCNLFSHSCICHYIIIRQQLQKFHVSESNYDIQLDTQHCLCIVLLDLILSIERGIRRRVRAYIFWELIHYYVTDLQELSIKPGLGESEEIYAWAVTMYSIGELIGALLAGSIKRVLPYRLCFLLGTLLCPLGYAVYSSAVAGWMVVLARLIIGMNCGLILSLITTYIGETTMELYKSKSNNNVRLSVI